jgi:hypothetical protein
MIRLPNGREIRVPRAGKVREINGVNYPERDLFKARVAADLGIRFIVREKYDPKYYIKTGEAEVDDGTTITITPTLSMKYTVSQLAKGIGRKIKDEAIAAYKSAKIKYDDLTDADSPIFDDTDPYVSFFEMYRAELKAAVVSFRSELSAIVMGADMDQVKYQALIDYQYSGRWPAIQGGV